MAVHQEDCQPEINPLKIAFLNLKDRLQDKNARKKAIITRRRRRKKACKTLELKKAGSIEKQETTQPADKQSKE